MSGNLLKTAQPRRCAFVILMDRSSQMGNVITIDKNNKQIGEIAIEVLNNTLSGIFMRANQDGVLHDIFDIAILLYSGDGVESCFGSIDNPFISISEISKSSPQRKFFTIKNITPLDSPDDYEWLGENGLLIEFSGSRAMKAAYEAAYRAVNIWCQQATQQRSMSYKAPYIINICSGAPDDSDLRSVVNIAKQIQTIETKSEERCNIVNILLSNVLETHSRIQYPTDEELSHIPNSTLRALGEASSYLSEVEHNDTSSPRHRALLYNDSAFDLIMSMKL